MTEKDLAAKLHAHLMTHALTVYQEVALEGKRCDIITVHNNSQMVSAHEVKLNLNPTVIAQAKWWRGWCNYAYAVVRKPKRPIPSQERQLLYAAAMDAGVGVIELEVPEDPHAMVLTHQAVKPRRNDTPNVGSVLRALRDEQKDFAPAGNANGAFFSGYQQSVKTIKAYLAKHGKTSVKELVKSVDLHWKDRKVSQRKLLALADANSLVGIKKSEEGGLTYLSLEGGGNG